MSVRLRRLQSEYERLQLVFAQHERIQIIEAVGRPPERYVVEFKVKGLVEEGGQIRERDTHRAEITLGADYPRQMPRCVMLTPVFHPNIDHLTICTEDIGSAGQTLDHTIIFIGEMISFQVYNLQSPRNGDAARWTKDNAGQLPLETVDLFPQVLMDTAAQVAVALRAAEQVAEIERERGLRCVNCGAPADPAGRCLAGHATCADCALECGACHGALCLGCAPRKCRRCGGLFCERCVAACERCGSSACLAHQASPCEVCA